MNVKDVANRLGYTEWQARKLIYACRPLLADGQGWLGYGTNGELQINPQALPILERAKELRLAGIPRKEVVKCLASELGKPMPDRHDQPWQGSASTPASPDLRDELIKELRDRISSLERDKAFLQAKLDEALSRIPALPPPAAPRLSRWQALKIALLGR